MQSCYYQIRFGHLKLQYTRTFRDYHGLNSSYSITLLLFGSMLFGSNVWANTPISVTSSTQSQAQPAIITQKFTQKDALLQSMFAEFDFKHGFAQSAIDKYLPLALQTPSINVKRRALELSLENDDFESAFAIANVWVKQEPRDVPALFYLAHTAIKTHRYPTFVKVMDRILQLDANANLDAILTGILPEEQEDRDLLLETLYSIQKRDNPSLLVLIATLEAHNGQYKTALKKINKALRKRPDTTSFILLKANLLVAMKEPDQALKWLKKSNNRYRQNTEVRLAEIQLLTQHKQEALAAKRLKNALTYNPKAENLILLAGLTHIDQQQYEQAEHYLLQLQNSPRFQHDANYYLGINAERKGLLESALVYYRQVDGSLYIVSRQAMIRLYEQLGQSDELLRFLTQERVNQPTHASFLYQTQAEILEKSGHRQEALALLKEASQDLPDDPDLVYAQVLLLDPYVDQKKLDQLLERLLAIEPNSPTYLNAYAYTLALQNRHLDQARKYAEQALAQAPDQASILDTLGYVAFLQSDFKTAVQALSSAYKKNPNINTALKYAKALYMNGDLDIFHQLLQHLKTKYPQNEQVSQLELLIPVNLPDTSSPSTQGTDSQPPSN